MARKKIAHENLINRKAICINRYTSKNVKHVANVATSHPLQHNTYIKRLP